jgi:Co/Zn/Cd efflux system component
MHLWTIIPEMIVFSAHISLKEDKGIIDKEELITDINKYLKKRYNIVESTIQISSDEELLKCN